MDLFDERTGGGGSHAQPRNSEGGFRAEGKKGRDAEFQRIGVAPQTLQAPGRTAAFKRREKLAGLHRSTAREALADFDRGTHIFGVTKGQFSLIDLAAAVLEKTGCADVAVFTWCIAEYEVEAFTAFMNNGLVKSLHTVMDWAGAQRDMPIIAELQERFGVDSLRVTKTHAKIVTISNAAGWRVVIRGSMNLNSNPRFEQFDISDDEEIFDVVHELLGELWERGRPIPIRQMKHAEATALLDAGGEASPIVAVPWAADLSTTWFQGA